MEALRAATDELGGRPAFHVRQATATREVGMLLERKNAVIHGAGGGVARTFAREGARVFLAGRTGPPLEAVAAEIRAAGGSAEVAVLDLLRAVVTGCGRAS